MTVSLLASQCPAIQTPGSIAYRKTAHDAAGTATLLTSYRAPEAGNAFLGVLNGNQAASEMLSRYGGGGYALAAGLTLSQQSGLVLAIAAGHAVCDGLVEVPLTATLTLPDNTARLWIWITRAAVISYRTDSSSPATPSVFLGSCVTSSGQITSIDTSGVVYLIGGQLWRQTADLGVPSDTPPSSARCATQTLGGLWQWLGSEWAPVQSNLPVMLTVVPAGDSEVVPANYQSLIIGSLTVRGTVAVRGQLIVRS